MQNVKYIILKCKSRKKEKKRVIDVEEWETQVGVGRNDDKKEERERKKNCEQS